MTCADQTFYTGFATSDFGVKLYAMNFRKGSQINRQKVDTENKRSRKLLNTLPLTLHFTNDAIQEESDDNDYSGAASGVGGGRQQRAAAQMQSRVMDNSGMGMVQ